MNNRLVRQWLVRNADGGVLMGRRDPSYVPRSLLAVTFRCPLGPSRSRQGMAVARDYPHLDWSAAS